MTVGLLLLAMGCIYLIVVVPFNEIVIERGTA